MKRFIYADRHKAIHTETTHTYAQMKYKCSISVQNYCLQKKKKKKSHAKFWILYPSSPAVKQKISCLPSLALCPCTLFIPFNFLCQKYLQFPDNSVGVHVAISAFHLMTQTKLAALIRIKPTSSHTRMCISLQVFF